MARGIVSLVTKVYEAPGELQLWYHERANHYYLYASNTAGLDMAVGKVIDVFQYSSLPKVH